jgi:hypothetical protein
MSFGDHMNANMLMEGVTQPVSWDDLCKDNLRKKKMLESALQKGYVRETESGCYCFTKTFLDSQIEKAEINFKLARENLEKLLSLEKQLRNH